MNDLRRISAPHRRTYLALALGMGLTALLVFQVVLTFTAVPLSADGGTPWPAPAIGNGTLPPAPTQLYLPIVRHLYPYFYRPPANPFGVQVYNNNAPSRAYSETERLGVEWIRLPIFWSQIEPVNTTPEHYQWGKWDSFLLYANQHHMNVILTFTGNPEWAATFPAGPIDRTDISELEEFFGAMVERYNGNGFEDAPGSPVVRYYEIYNEPDNADILHAEAGWGYWGHNGAGYADLLKHINKAVRRHDDETKILFGGLAYDWFEENGGPFVREFLDDVLNAWGGRYFDILDFHYYPAFADDWAAYGPGIRGKANYLQSRMEWHHVYKPMLCSETGWHSNIDSTPATQSQYLVKIMTRGTVTGLEAIIWFRLTDTETYPYFSGLLDLQDRPKPAYQAYQTAINVLSNAQYDRPLSYFETHSQEVEGYHFTAPDLQVSSDVTIAWSNDGITHTFSVPTDRLVVLDMYGSGESVNDADDGEADGQTTLYVGPDPIYYFEVLR